MKMRRIVNRFIHELQAPKETGLNQIYIFLTWLRFFRAFSSVVRQMAGYISQRQGTVRTLPN